MVEVLKQDIYLDPSSSMASVPLEEGKLDSSIKPGDMGGSINDGDLIFVEGDPRGNIDGSTDDVVENSVEGDVEGNTDDYDVISEDGGSYMEDDTEGDNDGANDCHLQAICAKITVTEKTELHAAVEAGDVHRVGVGKSNVCKRFGNNR